MEPKEHITEYITRVEKVANQLGRNGEQMPSSRVVGKILRSLTKDLESIVCAIEESKNLSVLTVDELAGLLKAKVLEAEAEEAKDEVDVAGVILRMIVKSKPVNRIGVIEDKGKAEEIGQELSVLSVASMTTMQTSINQASSITMASLAILQSIAKPRQRVWNPIASNILSMDQIIEKGTSIFMKDQVLYLKDEHGRLATQAKTKKNRLYEL
ncbi:uncharacterized protein LOC124822315 [Vigna umbellata]|uniref:uncharacterized protein LOC124822315 n=1 Tax=Vigna umbellata TaxID=87088 RepID=UPI001F5FD367|nr:uncharacterized protein LOC124822315 [Vigna umbellata]